MRRRWEQYRTISSTLFPAHERSVDRLGALSMFLLFGLVISGVAQFLLHESNPSWFGYVPDSGFDVVGFGDGEQPLAVVAHRFFGAAAGIVALAGSGWFMWRILQRPPVTGVVAFVGVLGVWMTQAFVRYNVIKIDGQSFDEVEAGHLPLFFEPVEYVVTDIGQFGPWLFRLMLSGHMLSVPVLVWFAWRSITRQMDRDLAMIESAPRRTWGESLR